MTDENISELAERAASLPAIRTILESISRQANMGFSAVAIVTGERWVLAARNDLISLDLDPVTMYPLKRPFVMTFAGTAVRSLSMRSALTPVMRHTACLFNWVFRVISFFRFT